MLKTLHLTNAYHPESGGVRSVYTTLLDAAGAMGRLVRLVVPATEDGVEEAASGGRIYYVKAPRALLFDRRYRLIMPWRYLLPGADRVAAILRDERPDIVEIADKHSLCYVAGLLRKGWIRGAPRPTLVGTSTERFDDAVETFVSGRPAARAFARWFMRAIYAPMFDCHLANSPYTADELRAALPPHRQHAVHVSPPVLSAEWFEPVVAAGAMRARLLQALGGSSATRLAVYVGRLSREKNLGLLLGMMERLAAGEAGGPDVRLVVAGSGPLQAELEEAGRGRLRGRIHLVGPLCSREAVRQLLACADVFVHPNPREPFGLAPLEAMASDVPVVVPDRGGVLTYADRSTAWLAPPTPDAFAAAVRDVLMHPLMSATRAAAGVDRAAAFHEALLAPRYFALLDAVHAQRLEGQATTMSGVMPAAIAGETMTSR